MQRLTLFIATVVTTSMMGATVSAQDLVYRPVNPSFGGNPLNSAHLLGTAGAQRTATARDADTGFGRTPGEAAPGQTDADLFVRQLQGRLLSALAAEVTDAIFGANPQEGGTVTFGTTTVEFQRNLDSIRLVIADNLNGTVTEIIVPQLVTQADIN